MQYRCCFSELWAPTVRCILRHPVMWPTCHAWQRQAATVVASLCSQKVVIFHLLRQHRTVITLLQTSNVNEHHLTGACTCDVGLLILQDTIPIEVHHQTVHMSQSMDMAREHSSTSKGARKCNCIMNRKHTGDKFMKHKVQCCL
jgi:hypothetical protein